MFVGSFYAFICICTCVFSVHSCMVVCAYMCVRDIVYIDMQVYVSINICICVTVPVHSYMSENI